jgi:predicted nucleotide-binding protein
MAARFEGCEGERLLCEVIRRQPLFEGHSDVADQLARLASIEPYEPGAMIIEQDGTDTDIFFILSGSVTISPNRRDDAVRSAGNHVGEMATIDPIARRSADVRANEPTVIARVSEPDFSRVANAHPFIWRHLAREMADRLRQRVVKVPKRKANARVFVASSRESLNVATALQSTLSNAPVDLNIWTKGIFIAGMTNIEALEAELLKADFAVILLSPDDEVISRGITSEAPRDNLIFKLGLFVGALGRRRALMVHPHGIDLKIPTDLLGVNPIKYNATDMAALATELQEIFASQGPK